MEEKLPNVRTYFNFNFLLGKKGNEEYYLKEYKIIDILKEIMYNHLDEFDIIHVEARTEDELRRYSRDYGEIRDLGIELPNWAEKYFDCEALADDMEEEWYERADVWKEEERDGETYYLCEQSRTNFQEEFLDSIKSYEEICEDYDEFNLTENQYNLLIHLYKLFNKIKDQINQKIGTKNKKNQTKRIYLLIENLCLIEDLLEKNKVSKEKMREVEKKIITSCI